MDSRKRPRTDMESEPAGSVHDRVLEANDPPANLAELKRHEQLWFDDGSVILVARDLSFRVHSGYLARASPTLRDACTPSQHAHTERLHDCPVVRLSDTAEDVIALLDVLYAGTA